MIFWMPCRTLLCVSALPQCVSACVNWRADSVHFSKVSHLKTNSGGKKKLWASVGATTMRIFLVYNHIGGLSCHWALQFSTFPDEWYSKAYFHSHVINTFLPHQHSNPLQATCPCNFRTTQAKAARGRALWDSSLMLLQSVLPSFLLDLVRVHRLCENGPLYELNVCAASPNKRDIRLGS